MTKLEALIVLMQDARSEKMRKGVDHRRVLRAIATLGLEPDEKEEVLQWLEHHDDEGKPYSWTVK